MSAVEEYLAANVEFEEAKAALNNIASLITRFGAELGRNPERIHFSNTSVGLPIDVAMNSASQSVDANEWPTPDKIHLAIARRYEAKRKVENKWAAIPQAMRSALIPPKT